MIKSVVRVMPSILRNHSFQKYLLKSELGYGLTGHFLEGFGLVVAVLTTVSTRRVRKTFFPNPFKTQNCSCNNMAVHPTKNSAFISFWKIRNFDTEDQGDPLRPYDLKSTYEIYLS